ncbi:MAG TPA: hypothetical protein VF219_01855 [Vicinamibacterales bacterium]
MLSRLVTPPRERLIVAVDIPSIDEAKTIVVELGDSAVSAPTTSGTAATQLQDERADEPA